MGHETLSELLESLYPICFFLPDSKASFRNKSLLLSVLRKNVPSLDNFYLKNAKTADLIDRETNLTKVTL